MTENPYKSPSAPLQASKYQTTWRRWLSIIPMGAIVGGLAAIAFMPQFNAFVMGALLGLALGTVLYAIFNLTSEVSRRPSEEGGDSVDVRSRGGCWAPRCW